MITQDEPINSKKKLRSSSNEVVRLVCNYFITCFKPIHYFKHKYFLVDIISFQNNLKCARKYLDTVYNLYFFDPTWFHANVRDNIIFAAQVYALRKSPMNDRIDNDAVKLRKVLWSWFSILVFHRCVPKTIDISVHHKLSNSHIFFWWKTA